MGDLLTVCGVTLDSDAITIASICVGMAAAFCVFAYSLGRGHETRASEKREARLRQELDESTASMREEIYALKARLFSADIDRQVQGELNRTLRGEISCLRRPRSHKKKPPTSQKSKLSVT